MIDQFTRDVLAAFIIGYGLIIAVMEYLTWRKSELKYRWVFLAQGVAGFLCSLVFVAALLRLYNNGTDAIDAGIGRPMYLILLTAMFLSALVDRIRGDNDCL